MKDITYLRYDCGTFAYLSVRKDSCTNQILSYVLNEPLEVDFVLETVKQLLANHEIPKNQKTLIQSDQGLHYHYMSVKFQKLLEEEKLRQSMSRRGNCWDNASQESFFGHMKVELPNLGKGNLF